MSGKQVDPLEDTRAESIRPGKMIAGAQLGGYNLLDVLGEGGMGVVWAAHDPLLDRRIAIKVLKHDDASSQLRLRLLREGRAMAKLKHPNVLTVHGVGTEGDRDFIAMELVEGGSLDVWLATHPPRDEVMTALLAAGRGLAAAHAAGLVHRDFKPNNVLRTRDGRVLVTDFGLARALDDDWGAAVSASGNNLEQPAELASQRDSVLHSPLTRTGAMIGTPAYMAPEQFTGAEPDPRTDQFAFCVTAWQALTGARPFHGKTLEELRQAANAGVATVVSDLPKPLRTVLARGLDPDPDKRWPDLNTLLAELEIAGTPRPSRWPLIAGGVAVAAIAAIAIVKLRGGSDAATPVCEPAVTVWADAVDKHASDDPRIANAFQVHGKRWFQAYEQACKTDGAKRTDSDAAKQQRAIETKVACLRAVRDRTAAMAAVVTGGSKQVAKAFDPFTLLVSPDVCAAGVVPVALPETARDHVTELVRAAIEAPTAKPDARASEWPPLAPMLEINRGYAQLRAGDLAAARASFEHARATAEPIDPRTHAFARLALLEVSLAALEHPEELSPKRDQYHEELGKQLTYAKSAVKTAGNEPILAGILAMREAEATADLAERAPKKATYSDALARVDEARKQFERLGDVRRIARAAALAAEIHLRRGDGTSLTDADHVASSASELLAREGEPVSPALESIIARVSFARADYESAGKAYDKIAATHAPVGRAREGVVLDADGKPAMGATVVAWSGELAGDPKQLVTDRRTLDGDIVETGADGKFTIHAIDGAAIIAQRGDLVSAPSYVGDKMSLALAPTTEITGKVDGKAPFGLAAFARIAIGPHAWLIRAAVAREGQTYRIAHLPAGGKPQLGVQLEVGGAVHRALAPPVSALEPGRSPKLAWPDGLGPIDVVVKGALSPGARLYLFPHKVDAGSEAHVAEVEHLVATGTDSAFGTPVPIGSRITEAGRRVYTAGARHVILLGDSGGSACAGAGPEPTAKVVCAEVKDGATLIELPAP